MHALIIGERSLLNSSELGTTSQKIAENIYNGGPFKDLPFRGLPVVVLFGDDYQLPSTSEGAFASLQEPRKNIGKMTYKGRDLL